MFLFVKNSAADQITAGKLTLEEMTTPGWMDDNCFWSIQPTHPDGTHIVMSVFLDVVRRSDEGLQHLSIATMKENQPVVLPTLLVPLNCRTIYQPADLKIQDFKKTMNLQEQNREITDLTGTLQTTLTKYFIESKVVVRNIVQGNGVPNTIMQAGLSVARMSLDTMATGNGGLCVVIGVVLQAADVVDEVTCKMKDGVEIDITAAIIGNGVAPDQWINYDLYDRLFFKHVRANHQQYLMKHST